MEWYSRIIYGLAFLKTTVRKVTQAARELTSKIVTLPSREELEELFRPVVITPQQERLQLQFITRRLLNDIIMEREYILEFKTSIWRYSTAYFEPDMIRVTPHSWITVDVVLYGPDGQLIRVIDLKMPPGRKWDLELFHRKLAAELKRMERKGIIKPIGNASAYIASSIIDFVTYKVTRYPIK